MRLEVATETSCHLLDRLDGSPVATIDMDGVDAERTRCEADVRCEAFVALGAVSEPEYFYSLHFP